MRRYLAIILVAVVALTTIPALAATPSLFTEIHAISTKTGFRGVFAWEATRPVKALVHFGTDSANLNLTTAPAVDTPDTAGLAVGDVAESDIGKTFFYQVEDQLSGERSEIGSFVATNAYNDYNGSIYTLDLMVQLDAQSLDPSIPADQSLEEIAQGISIMAERIYDALDGKARIGKVIVTDTNVGYAANLPGVIAHPRCAEGNVADVVVTTAVPFDSHTFGGWSIDDECVSFYVGRLGWLVVPWEDDLMFGHVGAHEFMHYAFNAPDLYGPVTDADCVNPAWDGSLMHNTGGFEGGRWVNTELDRNPTLTPCDHGSQPYTWDRLRQRYTQVPANPNGPIDHIIDDQARGNLDGGALDIVILDREPGSSTLEPFVPNDADEADPPGAVSCTADGPVLTDAEGDAKQLGLSGGSTYQQGPNEPALDIRSLNLTWDQTSETLGLDLKVTDLGAANPDSAPAAAYNVNFSYEGETLYVEAARGATGEHFRLGRFVSSARVHLLDIAGQFDPATETIRLELTNDDLAAIGATALIEEDQLSSIEAVSRRGESLALITAGLSADTSDNGCPYTIGHGAITLPPSDDPDGSISLTSPTHSWSGYVLADGVVPFTGTNLSDCDQGISNTNCERQVIHVTAPTEGAPIKFHVNSYAPDGFMVRVYGPDEQLFGEAGTIGDSSATVNGVATVTGLYTVVLRPWSAVDAEYDAYAHIGPEAAPAIDATLTSTTPQYSWSGVPRTEATAALGCSGRYACETSRIEVVPDTGGNQVTITATADNQAANDIDLYVYDSSGSLVAQSAHEGGDEALNFFVEASGVYDVLIKSYLTVDAGYEATAGLHAPLPPPDSSEFDGEISPGESYEWSGLITPNPIFYCQGLALLLCDNEYINVNVPSGGATLTVVVTPDDQEDLLGCSVYVYDPDGTRIAEVFFTDGVITIQKAVTKTGVYRVGVATSTTVQNYNATASLSSAAP